MSAFSERSLAGSRSRLKLGDLVKLTRRYFSITLGTLLIANALAPVSRAEESAKGGLEADLAKIEVSSGARLGVAVHDLNSGKRYGHRQDERFPMCSTFKVLAAGAVLSRVDAGEEQLSRRVHFEKEDLVTYSPVTEKRTGGDGMTMAELCEAALTQSDNTAANLILNSLGGPEKITAYARALGDEVTRLDRNETSLNEAKPGDPRDTTSPAAMANDLRKLALDGPLSPASRQQLIDWMVSNKTGDTRLRAGVPKDWKVADKTGSGDFGTTNDVAILWPPGRKPLIVCLYLTESKASVEDRNAVIAAVGKAVAARLGN